MKHNESNLQIACVNWFRWQFPGLALLLFAVPNGGKRAKKLVKTKFGYKTVSLEGSRLKQEGATSGVADLILLYGNGTHNALCIEMKYGKGRQSKVQKDWQEAAEQHGNRYEVINTFENFQKLIYNYLQETDFGKKI